MSWDVHLQKFDRGAETTFDLRVAARVLRETNGFRQAEPGVGELVEGGYAEISFGVEPSSTLMVSVRSVLSPTVFRLIYSLAVELRMVVFFEAGEGWAAAVVEPSQADDLPDPAWEGWEDIAESYTPPTPILCRSADDLTAALAPSYESWEKWAHPG